MAHESSVETKDTMQMSAQRRFIKNPNKSHVKNSRTFIVSTARIQDIMQATVQKG